MPPAPTGCKSGLMVRLVRSPRERARRLRGRILTVLALVACAAFGVVAMAGGDDRSTAESTLKEVESSPRKDAAGDLVARSRAALERANKLRASGDEAHARLADGVARTWAEAARDVVRAAAVEAAAAEARRGATDAGALADRERAQLEEAIAQSGRLRAQLETSERGAREEPARTSTAATSDAGPKAAPLAKDAGASAPRVGGGKVLADGGAR